MNKIITLESKAFEKLYEYSRSKIDEIIHNLDHEIKSILFEKDPALLFAGRFVCNGFKIITDETLATNETFRINQGLIKENLKFEEAINFEEICHDFIENNYGGYENLLEEILTAEKQYEFYKNKV